MGFKTLIFVFLVIAVMVTPTAKAQVRGILGLIRIQGTLYCTANGNINGTFTPIFPNAQVQLQCGTGNIVASATTNRSGAFSFFLNPVQYLLTSVVSSCNIFVKTPLSSCDVTLPSVGGLVSSLQSIGNAMFGLISITDVIPTEFQFFTNINLN